MLEWSSCGASVEMILESILEAKRCIVTESQVVSWGS
jgi:hypothetical protein